MSTLSDIGARRASAHAGGQPEYLKRHAEVVEAAARVFRRKGFRAANLQDIAEELAMDRASLYYYTSGKDELFQEVVTGAVQENVIVVERLSKEDIPADEKLAKLIKDLMDSYERHYPYLFVYIQENMAHLDSKTKWNREMLALGHRFDLAVREIVQQGLDEGAFVAHGDARLLANGIIGMCNWSNRWFHPKDKGESVLIATAFANLILNGLKPRGKQSTKK